MTSTTLRHGRGLLLGGTALGAALAALLLFGAGAAPAADPPSSGRDLAVTIYNENLGVVKDRRTVSVGRGTSDLTLTDISPMIDPTSVHLRPIGNASLEVLWQEFHYDLASTERLLQRYMDQQIEVRLKGQSDVRRGVLLSFDATSLFLREPGGGIVVITRSEVLQVSLASLPRGVVTRPTLIWRVRSESGGNQPVEVSYMTGGMTWHAEYVAAFDEASTQLDLRGWATVENSSGETYEDALVKLVAGAIHRAPPPMAPAPHDMRMRGEIAMATSAKLAQRGFSEYHLYELPARATIATNEVKQLALMHASGVRTTRKFVYDAEKNPEQVMTTLEFQNEGAGLGIPLPGGTVRVYQRDRDGALEFVGEDLVKHTPKNEPVRLAIGGAFDVAVERKQTNYNQVSQRETQVTFEITLKNHKSQAIDVTVVEHAYGDWEILRSSHPAKKKDATSFEFAVRVPAEQSATVTYTLRTRMPGVDPR